MSKVVVMDHPLIQHKIGIIRREETGSKDFRTLVSEIAMLMCYEATRDLKLTDVEINTPICKTTVKELKGKKLAVVPILRAGLGMVDGMLNMIPAAKVGHIGLYRDPETLEPVEYYCKLPADCANREVFVVDPMLATGGSSVAAIQMLKDKGVKIGYVTLHVGIGTFRPVKTENIEEHKMHSEHYHLPKETADLINETHNNGGRVVAVGTTCCRTLESVATYCGEICEKDDWTSIFIYPGYKFKCIDALITNFHLPESTLIMLVSAFYNREDVLKAYEEAVKEKYRFFSFGDCMLIV